MAGDLILAQAPLVDLCGALGVTAEQLAAVEDADSLTHGFPVSAAAVAGLRMEIIQRFAAAFGDSGQIELRTGDLTEIVLGPAVNDASLSAFTSDVSPEAGPYEALVRIDKTELAARLAGAAPRRDVRVYLFTDALLRALARGITRFESEVWTHAPAPLVLGVADADIKLTGPLLSVLGGTHLGGVEAAACAALPDGDAFAEVIAARDRHIGWDTPWVRGLTPWHFELTGTCEHMELHRVLRAQLLKLAVLFTCDRARTHGSGPTPVIRAEYRGREHVAVIPIDERAGVDATADEVAAMLRATDWCYRRAGTAEPDWVSDRLPFIQTRVAQTLEPHPEEARLAALAHAMPYLLEGIEWHWKAFIEGKVGEYLAGVQQVETIVAETVTSFADRSASLAKSLSDSILAAVAVLIGSFIAAAFKEPFDETLFRIGVRTYAVYVILFPGVVGLFAAHGSLQVARAGFDARMTRFKEAIYSAKVDDIVGNRVSDAQRSVYRWLGMAAVTYTIVGLIAWTGAEAVVDHVTRAPASTSSTSTTTTTPGSDPALTTGGGTTTTSP